MHGKKSNYKELLMAKKMMQSFMGVAFLVLLLSSTATAEVSVYAEGAYTDTDLVVYIYADVPTTGSPLVSYGIKLTYDVAQVGSPVVNKNDAVWFFGSSTSPLPTPNAEPDISIPGEVVIVGGKIDELVPTEGVSGPRQLIADVTFARFNTSAPPVIGLELGRDGSYVNFVQVNGTLLDENGLPNTGLAIGATAVYQRGDANKDSFLNFADMSRIRAMMEDGEYSIWADCNDDGFINFADMSCVRSNM